MPRFYEWGDDPEAPGLLEVELWDSGESEGREPYVVVARGSLPQDTDRAAVERELATEASTI